MAISAGNVRIIKCVGKKLEFMNQFDAIALNTFKLGSINLSVNENCWMDSCDVYRALSSANRRDHMLHACWCAEGCPAYYVAQTFDKECPIWFSLSSFCSRRTLLISSLFHQRRPADRNLQRKTYERNARRWSHS